MPTLDEFASQEETVATAQPESAEELAAQPVGPRIQLPEFLKAKTGPGPIEDYIDHPMNIGRSPHFARILRGLTGMFTALDYAIVDIVIGAAGFKKKPPVMPQGPGPL